MSAPEIVTFYSYKGGTGRSMALANVAWILAANGKRVLVIDWDLEAPGLHRYFHPFLGDKELVRTDGLIDFVMRYAELSVSKTKRAKGWHKPYANILRYATSLSHPFPDRGAIDFVSAGRQGADYATRVNAFNWQHFYERLSGGLFLEAAKASMADYDYVLIDSRTGVSDTSGICTIQMPNTLVVCFTLNTQSIEGAAAVAESADAQRRNVEGKSTLRILPVPTRVELTERDKLNAGMEAARRRFDPLLGRMAGAIDDYWARVAVQYQPFYAYEEVLAVFGDTPGKLQSMLASMESLAGWITGADRPLPLPALPSVEREALLARYLREHREESRYVIRRLTSHTAPVKAMAISPDGNLAVSGDSEGRVIVWRIDTGAQISARSGLPIRAVAFGSDGRQVIVGSDDGELRIWPLDPLQGTRAFMNAGSVYALAATGDGAHVISGHANNSLSVFRIGDLLELEHVLVGHSGPVWAVAVTADSRFAISGSFDRILTRWDLETAWQVMTYSGHSGEVSSVAVSGDGSLILSGSYDNTLRLWDLNSGALLRTFEGHTGRVQAVALSPDGRIAASGSADKIVQVWDVATGRVLLRLSGHSAAVNAVAVTPDGQRVISASDDGTLILWNIEEAIAGIDLKPVTVDFSVGLEKPLTVGKPLQLKRPPAPAVSNPPPEGPMVYLSFSRRDRDRYLNQFVADLEHSLHARLGESGDTVFWWDDNLFTGDSWPDPVIDALRSARAAVCLFSPSYFESVNCGREFSIFQMRAGQGRGIYPIVWRPPVDWPEAITNIQISNAEVGAYRDEGLAYVMKLSRHRLAYEKLVDQFAGDLTEMIRRTPLIPIARLPHVETLPNAFAGRDTELPQAGPRRVEFVIQAESPFGKPLFSIAQEIAAEFDLYSIQGRADDAGIIDRTARGNIILVIILDSSQTRWLDGILGSNRPPDLSHCILLVVNPSGKLSLWRPPRDIGYYGPGIQTEAALRDSLRTAIIKTRQAIIAKAAVAGGGGEPTEPTPKLPATS